MSIKLLTEQNLGFLSAYKEAAQARLSLHLSNCHVVGNHMSWLLMFHGKIFFQWKSPFFQWKWINKVQKQVFLPQYVTFRVIPHIILDTCISGNM